MSNRSVDSDVHQGAFWPVGESLHGEGVDPCEGCSEDTKGGVVGVAIVENGLVEPEGAGSFGGRVVGGELGREGHMVIHGICGDIERFGICGDIL